MTHNFNPTNNTTNKHDKNANKQSITPVFAAVSRTVSLQVLSLFCVLSFASVATVDKYVVMYHVPITVWSMHVSMLVFLALLFLQPGSMLHLPD